MPPYLKRVFPPQLFNLEAPSQMCPEGCLLGDLESANVTVAINHDKVKHGQWMLVHTLNPSTLEAETGGAL